MTLSRAFPGGSMRPFIVAIVVLGTAMFAMVGPVRADITPFVGQYSGSAEVMQANGTKIPRDMSVEINETKQGFTVKWSSVTHRASGKLSEKSYSIDFVPSGRGDVYAAAQRKNVFGHEVQLDPMKGEPYVWARIDGETLTVYSLFVDTDGGYSLQRYDRTLTEGGLNLNFQNIQDGEILRAVETFLVRD
ncbi:hypothetical protein GCM10007385_11630 [Tateyamaria omphalii]|uniref:hypothetical protein n=1 Tax=Tateyamaria omphalii TaxID=299262 RepID=UPI001997D46C|nr:hypothetical protein [Tateyamaria omphalii]GGX45813.1 hypothetical protein GCM10007385_11630 [Tateyamaria omphalii]